MFDREPGEEWNCIFFSLFFQYTWHRKRWMTRFFVPVVRVRSLPGDNACIRCWKNGFSHHGSGGCFAKDFSASSGSGKMRAARTVKFLPGNIALKGQTEKALPFFFRKRGHKQTTRKNKRNNERAGQAFVLFFDQKESSERKPLEPSPGSRKARRFA